MLTLRAINVSSHVTCRTTLVLPDILAVSPLLGSSGTSMPLAASNLGREASREAENTLRQARLSHRRARSSSVLFCLSVREP